MKPKIGSRWRDQNLAGDILQVVEVTDKTVRFQIFEPTRPSVWTGGYPIESWEKRTTPQRDLDESVQEILLNLRTKREANAQALAQHGLGSGAFLEGVVAALDDVIAKLEKALAEK